MSTESHSLPPLESPLGVCVCLVALGACPVCILTVCDCCCWLCLCLFDDSLCLPVYILAVCDCLPLTAGCLCPGACLSWCTSVLSSRFWLIAFYLTSTYLFISVILLAAPVFLYISSDCLCLSPGYFFRLLAVLLSVFLFPTFLLATSVDWLFVTWLCVNVS